MIKKITLIFFFFVFTVNASKAQNWGGGIDDTNINWGYSFQYIVSELKITKNSNWRDPFFISEPGPNALDELTSISSPTSVGFGVGFVINGRVNRNVDVRVTPSLSFNDRLIHYKYTNPTTSNAEFSLVQKKIQVSGFDLPIGLKLKSDRFVNFRPYILGGVKYSVELASAKKTNDDGFPLVDKLIKNNRSFLSYEAALGLDIYFEWFKMSPEIKVSNSFRDILKHENNPYDSPIDKAKLRHFTFSLFFE